MICDGDRILVCISGGKDSLSLLHTLRQYQFVAKSKVKLCDANYSCNNTRVMGIRFLVCRE